MMALFRGKDPLAVAINLCGLVAAFLIAAMALAVTYSVIAREFFGGAPVFIFEFTEYSLFLLTFLALAFVARQDGHVRMDLLDEFLPAKAMRVVNLVGDLIVLAIALGLFIATLWTTIDSYRSGVETHAIVAVQRWMLLSVVPLGTGLFLLQHVRSTWRTVRARGSVDRPSAAGVSHTGTSL